MQELKNKLIVALDVDSLAKAVELVEKLYPAGVKIFKVGSPLFSAFGPEAVKMVGSKGAKVFLDLKWLDIPNTVFLSASLGTGLNSDYNFGSGVFMMTVHIQGGSEMLKAAFEGADSKAKELNIERPRIVGVTVLTSDSAGISTKETVLERAKLAKQSGLDGIVCSVAEAAAVRKECGKDFIIVTPGIRPKGAAADDQSRVATFSEAVKAGADYVVVGRPIVEAKDPLKALEQILTS